MKVFLISKGFKIFVIIFVCLAVLCGASYGLGKSISPQSSFFGAVVTPVQHAFSAIGRGVNNFFTSIDRAEQLEQEKTHTTPSPTTVPTSERSMPKP